MSPVLDQLREARAKHVAGPRGHRRLREEHLTEGGKYMLVCQNSCISGNVLKSDELVCGYSPSYQYCYIPLSFCLASRSVRLELMI